MSEQTECKLEQISELESLPYLGEDTVRLLNEIGITTVEQLRLAGSREAWLRIRGVDPSACYNRLCGLEGALQGMRRHRLPAEIKKNLREFYNQAARGN